MKRSLLVAVLWTVALAMVATACGSADGAAGTQTSTSNASPSASDLPNVDVVDVVTGETVNVSNLAPGDMPLLVWFWAPH